ncbi:MAG: DUF1833 family protein [Treponema sp.]|nr:DUF1833 family protein [Candidatus Treponema caballi]
MPNQLSLEATKAATASETDAVFLTILTIYVDGEETLNFVNDKQNLVFGGKTFYAVGFTAVLPDQSSDGPNVCKLEIDNVDLSVYKTIKTAAVNHKITCDIGVVLSDQNVYEQGPLHFVLRNIKANKSVISGELHDLYMHDRKFTTITYSPEDFPGMYY